MEKSLLRLSCFSGSLQTGKTFGLIGPKAVYKCVDVHQDSQNTRRVAQTHVQGLRQSAPLPTLKSTIRRVSVLLPFLLAGLSDRSTYNELKIELITVALGRTHNISD